MSAIAANENSAAFRMDRIYRRQRHIYDVTRKYYLLGRDRLIAGLNAGAGDRVLEIGCGTGRNLIRAARRYPRAAFFGIDVSGEMLMSARQTVARAGLSGRIMFAHADAAAFDPAALFGGGAFQRVVISYSLSMIPEWRTVLGLAAGALGRGGEMHMVDFGDGGRLPRWFVAGLRHWLALFGVTPRDDLRSELELLAARTGGVLHFERPYHGYAQYAVLRRADHAAIGSAR